MSPKGESITRVLAAVSTIETIVQGLGRMQESARYHANIVAAREALKSADAELKRLARKPESACEYQGCWERASAVHGVKVKVQFCETHSATSALPFRAKIGGA